MVHILTNYYITNFRFGIVRKIVLKDHKIVKKKILY